MPSPRRARRPGPLLAGSAAAATAALALLPAAAGAIGAPQARDGQGTFDVRSGVAAAAPGVTSAPARALERHLGPQGVVSIDPLTGTPRRVLRTDGTLTGPSGDAPAQIALAYVRAHRDLFKLSEDDLVALGAPVDRVSDTGTHFLRWTQHAGGVPVTGAGLRAQVAADGRLLSIQGSPLPDPSVATTVPRISASSALGRVRRDNGLAGTPAVRRAGAGPRRATTFTDDSGAKLVVFPTPSGNRLAWSVASTLGPRSAYVYLVDAATGRTLKRDSLVRYASGSGTAWSYAPGNGPVGGMIDGWRQEMRVFPDGWIADGATDLFGTNAWVFSDVNDNDQPDVGEEIKNSDVDGGGLPVWDYPFRAVSPIGSNCSAAYPCSWARFVSNSWQDNREQNGVQAFWFVNRFHDHLEEAPGIGFDRSWGNFEFEPDGRGDGVVANTDDGADKTLVVGRQAWPHHPDEDHLNNANMMTRPDGVPAVMQMYLFTAFDPQQDPTGDTNGGDDAAVVYHEYGHGLSSRLVTDEDGYVALNAPQSGAMGEAWSDWYAMDFLVEEGNQLDTPAPGEIVLGASLSQGRNVMRYAALDCPVGVREVDNCPPGGGFTYADYGKIWVSSRDGSTLGPEVHADGELWAQTLWDLRTAVIDARLTAGGTEAEGLADVRALVTDGMRGSVPNPSMLDMRDQILLAAQTVRGGAYVNLAWSVFAARGMGVYADSVSAWDPAPQESFKAVPAAGTASLSGTVTDATTGRAIVGANVWLPGMTTSVLTDASGRYTIPAAGTDDYPRLNVYAAGYGDAAAAPLTVAAGGSIHDVALRRNWALANGGATVASATAPDLTAAGCGPADAIDGTKAFGWGSYSPEFDGDYGDGPDAPRGPRTLTLRLTQAVDVTSFEIDPGAVCGDDDSASLGEYQLETSQDGTTWRTASAGTFSRADNHRLNVVTPQPGTTGAVTHVRVTMLRPQGGRGRSAADYMDMAELSVYGKATETEEPPRRGGGGDPGPPAEPREQPREEPRGQPRDIRKPRSTLKLAMPAKHGLTVLHSRAGMPLKVRFDEEVRVTATVTLPAKTARALGLTKRRARTFTLAGATVRRLAANRAGIVRLKLGALARRKLARTRSLRIVLTVVATDAAGNATKLVSRPVLRR